MKKENKKGKKIQKESNQRPDAQRDLGNGITLKTRFWLEKNGETFLASGRINILKEVDKLHSITNVAESLNMSYQHAWSLINKMNEQTNESLLISHQGGKGGGGTELTSKAKRLIEKYEQLQEEFNELINKITVDFNDDII